MAGVPQFGRGAEHVGQRVEPGELDEFVLLELVEPGGVAIGLRQPFQLDQLQRRFIEPAHLLELVAPGQAPGREELQLARLQRIELVEQARGLEAQRRGRFPRRPDIDQPVQRVFLLLQTHLVADRPGLAGVAAAESRPVVADDRFDRRE
ncbi:MAG: hypothetical protein BWZ08_02841 [candidate division BRC1 bacterium ADurb.BinA292]|nr:MAG: hypothetical protein BWZ08_02841 [candidate division BRC1 bacterium ADurb.BinA292]